MNYRLVPKIELHLHLDCSLSYRVVQQLDPSVTAEQYQREFVAPAVCADLRDYLTRAVKGFSLMQTRAALRLVTLDLLEQLAADNVVYAEIRFAPLLHTQQGLSPTAVVETVQAALEEGRSLYPVTSRLLLCTLRHFSEEQSLETARLAVSFFEKGWVVGFDMAGDEAGYSLDAHLSAFDLVHAHRIPVTVHAGEAAGPESVWQVIRRLRPARLGHGVRSIEDPTLVDYLHTNGIHLEVCPSSNIQTGIYKSLREHSVDQLYRKGLSLSISTDTRTITPVTLTHEYEQVSAIFGWGRQDWLRCNLEALRYAFAPASVKEPIKESLMAAYS